MNVKFIVKNTGKILKISSVRCNSVKFEIHIFRLHDKKLSLVLLQITIYIISPWKMWTENAICYKFFRYKIFVHWKLELLNFLVDSVLISRFTIAEDARAGCPLAALWLQQSSSFDVGTTRCPRLCFSYTLITFSESFTDFRAKERLLAVKFNIWVCKRFNWEWGHFLYCSRLSTHYNVKQFLRHAMFATRQSY